MLIQFVDNFDTLLVGALTNSSTQLSVTAGYGSHAPALNGADGKYVLLTLTDSYGNIEIIKAPYRSGDIFGNVTYPLIRGYGGTTARAWSTGARVAANFSAAALNDILVELNAAFPSLTGVGASGTWGINITGNAATASALASGGSITVKDANFLLVDDVDATKGAAFQLSAITAGQLRTYTLPDASVTLAGLSYAQAWSAKQTFNSPIKLFSALEAVTVAATVATGTINFDALTQGIVHFTANASANWTLNIRGNASNSLDSILGIGESITVTHSVPQGATAYYNSSVQIDGTTTGVTTKWQNAAPTAGDINSTDVYSYTVIKTAGATFTVLASKSKYV